MRIWLKYIGIFLLLSLIGAYFYFAAVLNREGAKGEVCRSIHVVILDSAKNRFVNSNDVVHVLTSYLGDLKGKRRDTLDLRVIEELLNKRIMVSRAEACININGEMLINITQRRPIIRIESQNGGFYIDDTKFIFPLADNYTSYVPIVSGVIPTGLYEDYRGMATPEIEEWINGIYNLALFLDKNPFWNAQIDQIYIDNKGDVYFCPRVGTQKVVFGDLNDIDAKFEKLSAFYDNVIPNVGWEMYDKINVKYKDQIVCTKRPKKKK